MATQSKSKKSLKDVGLIPRAALVTAAVAGGAYLFYQAYKSGKKPDHLKYDASKVPESIRPTLHDLATELFSVMSGYNLPSLITSVRSNAWYKISTLEGYPDMVKYLHNYWIDNIDSEESLFSWVNSQVTVGFTIEEENQDLALAVLQMAGAGE